MKKILFLIDNDRTVRMLYQEKLSLLGLEIRTSNDSEDIYETITYHKPDIIFTDTKRWEGLTVDPTLEYDIEPVSSGYVIGRATGCKKLDVRVKIENEVDGDVLELILIKSHPSARRSNLTADTREMALQRGLPPLMEIRHQKWEMPLQH